MRKDENNLDLFYRLAQLNLRHKVSFRSDMSRELKMQRKLSFSGQIQLGQPVDMFMQCIWLLNAAYRHPTIQLSGSHHIEITNNEIMSYVFFLNLNNKCSV